MSTFSARLGATSPSSTVSHFTPVSPSTSQAPATPQAPAPNSANKNLHGFALYVGLDPESVAASDPKIKDLIHELQKRLTELHPKAYSYTALAVAPEEVRGNSLDIVRLALGEPNAQKKVSSDRSRRKTGITIDFSRKVVFLDGFDAKLTYKEFELLQFLVLREGREVSREEIAKHLSALGSAPLQSGSRAIDVQVTRLRSKLAGYEQIIKTVRGKGYRFDRHADVRIVHHNSPSPDRI